MEKFICVRVVQGNGLDLSLFQFDYDLTFAAFLFNADRTLYARYGTRSDFKQAERDISLESFGLALAGALELHKNYPANKATPAGKQALPSPRFKTPEEFPSLSGRFQSKVDFEGKVVQSCIHCHQVREAERKVARTAGQPLTDAQLYPWPMPDAVGLALDPKEKAKVARVAVNSSAAKDGFKAGDEIIALAGQPMLSIADVQWVLHTAPEPWKISAEVSRAGKKQSLTLTLAPGWRRGSDIGWRPSSWDLRRSAFGGIKMDDLSDADRKTRGLGTTELALHFKHVGEYGDHALAKKAGFKKEDVLVAVDGQTKRMTESDLFAVMLAKPAGSKVPATVLRGGERLNLELPTQ